MGKKGKKGKKKDRKPSSGMRKYRDAQRRIKVLEKKVRRWDRYREAGKETKSKNTSRAKNWDTTGILKHIELLQGIQ